MGQFALAAKIPCFLFVRTSKGDANGNGCESFALWGVNVLSNLKQNHLESRKRVTDEGRTDFQCEYCLTSFGSKSNLGEHINKVHLELKRIKVKCNFCTLRRHVEAKHCNKS